ncbi:hypothetical protein C4580_02690 [Candidatus Woesearchaeota archaeon]|nr:MAG: hypothetical protein C4580_02690 [Candidatus Woesearchaeota archaeon]
MIPYFRQETEYTCGKACMRMVLASLGIIKSEQELSKFMSRTKYGGTNNGDLARCAELFRLSYVVSRNGKLRDVQRLQKKGYRVIVGFTDPLEKVGHFAIVRKVTEKFVYLIDPWHGPKHKMPRQLFVRNWKSMFESDEGFLIGIKK